MNADERTYHTVASFLDRQKLERESEADEQHCSKINVLSGQHRASINVYNSGKIVVGGKASPLKKLLLLIFLLALLCLETACSGLPRFTEYDGGSNAQARLAPLVVVATTDSDVPVGRIVPSRKDSTYRMQLHRVKAHIENVLKGSINELTVFVYYFRFAGAIDGPRPLGFGRELSRRILWLRKDAGAYRMACDGWDECTMVVSSGAHPGYRADPTEPLNQALVDILLTRGKGEINDLQFANQIRSGVPDEGIRG
jgi:hypothetical protein